MVLMQTLWSQYPKSNAKRAGTLLNNREWGGGGNLSLSWVIRILGTFFIMVQSMYGCLLQYYSYYHHCIFIQDFSTVIS